MESLTSIKGQVAVVTGGTAGMGEAAALRFGAEGLEDSAYVTQPPECADESEVKHATRTIIDNLGRVDILVNTAGGFIDAPPLEEVSNADMRHNFDWNVTAKFLITRELVPVMKSNNYGRIVNISSVAGRTARNGSSIEYSTNEAAILGMTRRLAVELAPFGITINAIAPGLVLTPRVRRHPPEILAEREKSIPVGRMGKPEELAHAIWYLCTPGAAFTTGAVLDVNGGNWTG